MPDSAGPARPAPAWHALGAEAVLDALGDGPNRLAAPPRQSAIARFLRQFHNALVYVLLGAAVVTLVIGHATDAAVIAGVTVVNAVIGFIQEGKAERSIEAIRCAATAGARKWRPTTWSPATSCSSAPATECRPTCGCCRRGRCNARRRR
jgi:magnesium-transporting ATPase (P-type)